MKNKIGIVGGSGYVGNALARYFLNSYKVKIIDLKTPEEDLLKNIEFAYCDITNFEELKKALNDVDLVVHTAIIQIPSINENKFSGYSVNILGTHNVCKAVEENSNIKGMLLSGTWHTIGEKELRGEINEEFGFRPDKVEDRARLYALSKMGQEAIVRFHDEMSNKIYGIIRMGTVLGKGMPEKTAANIFIERGIRGESITPYKHSMYRPMLYVDINDVCIAFEKYVYKILNNEIKDNMNSLAHIVNIYYPKPITIYELAKIIRNEIIQITKGKIKPKVEIVDKGENMLFTEEDKKNIRVNISKLKYFLEIKQLTNPKITLKDIINSRIYPEKK